jgi:hypothetical protein
VDIIGFGDEAMVVSSYRSITGMGPMFLRVSFSMISGTTLEIGGWTGIPGS